MAISSRQSVSPYAADEHSTEESTRTDPKRNAEATRRESLPKDLIFGLLSSERRRRLLTYLDENGGQTTLAEIAEVVAAKENDTSVKGLSSMQRKRVYVGLYQCHLPKLDDAGVVDYDRDRGTIDLRPEADQLFPHLYLDVGESTPGISPTALVPSTSVLRVISRLVGRGDR